MLTPFGKLSDINLDDTDTCAKILSEEKHQMLEGLVFEHLFDQILGPELLTPSFVSIPVFVAIARRQVLGREKGACAFVWYDQKNQHVQGVIDRLCKSYSVFPVTYDPQTAEFLTTPRWVSSGQCNKPSEPIHDVLATLMNVSPKETTISSSVREERRQYHAFWGYLETSYGSQLGAKLVLPRIFKNYAIQPFFDWVWDVDRLIEIDGKIWFLEVKHKFPFGRPLKFGMNVGQLKVVEGLAASGISCLHLIAVKPYWSKEIGAQYLLNNLVARERTLLICSILDKSKIEMIKNHAPRRSAAHTTFTGRGKLTYFEIPVTSFSPIGFLSSPTSETVARLSQIFHGGQKSFVTDEYLDQQKLPVPAY